MKFIFFVVVASMINLACNESRYMQGKRLYSANCQNCHMEDGSGLGTLIPPLASSEAIGTLKLVCIIRNGLQDTIREDAAFLVKEMPSFKKFSATEIANIVNYLNYTWQKNSFKEKTILEVSSKLESCQ